MGTCVSRKSPSLRAPRAETRLTVYRALRSLHDPQNDKKYKKSNFSESLRDSARRLPGWFQGPLGVFEACWNDFPRCQTKIEKSKFLVRKHVRSSFFTLNSCCVMFISLSSGFFCRGGDIALQSESRMERLYESPAR